jgi:translation elongation factor EF-Ts
MIEINKPKILTDIERKDLCRKLQLTTGVGLMDCQRALSLNEWNHSRAEAYLNSPEWRRGKLINYKR